MNRQELAWKKYLDLKFLEDAIRRQRIEAERDLIQSFSPGVSFGCCWEEIGDE